MKKDNITHVVGLLINALKIPVTQQSIEDELQKHPEHNSLLAISDLMNTWKVPNASYNLSLEDLSDVPKPFIAHLGKAGFVLVSEINENSICVRKVE